MLNALRILRPQSPLFISPASPSSYSLSRTCGIRLQSSSSGADPMDGSQKKNPAEEHMASFGVAYATRSDEEGFGGIYSGNQQFPEKESGSGADPMDGSQKKNPKEEHMASFGVGYATRCDEEGFGGIYSGNQQFPEKESVGEEDGKKAAEFDESQGSEVKEKEDSRHQKK